jgi:acyl transferase domain-containing protein/NAD(P)H-dependent flavin oxidoreductase YrpB (nitropropane dioxygenase family)/NAD(P)-dependent dehydrogenase (short-subunit alcohol dehydrogenase family)
VIVSALGFIIISPAGPRRAYTTPALAIAAARAGATGVLDLEYVKEGPALEKALQQLTRKSLNGRIGIRCRSGKLPAALLKLESSQPPLVVLTAGLGDFDSKKLADDIKEVKSRGFEVFVETISSEEAVLAQKAGADAIIAKGHESSGRVGDTTTFVLVQQCARFVEIPIWAMGGIGAHTAAAVAAAGAAGVVLDSQTYLCRDSAIPADVQLRFERLDGSETSLIRDQQSRAIRVMASNGSQRLQQLEEAYADGRVEEAEAVLTSNIDASDDEIFVVGQDSCFARNLAIAGGTVSGCIDLIRQSVAEHIEIAARSNLLAEGSELARSHGTQYPIVQGAMTRVSDTSEFALNVAQSGALPFLALSLMRGPEIDKLMTETRDKLGNMPWGVGVLGFVPQQLRQEQMEVVNRHKPPFALIAGGRPDQAKALDDAGTKTYLHVPSPLLLKSFIEMGSTRFIFEGKECGGHVGPRSSFVLWESMIEVLLESFGPGSKTNPANFHVLFAGGIHDDLSAAMVATMAAPLTARGIKIGMLVGTAYLFTSEAVSSGAIVPVFQDAAVKCDKTVLLETGPGHSIRCIDSPYREAFDRSRVELQKQNKSRDEVREELELMNLGRLRIASKGVARGTNNELESIPVEAQWRDGMYMIGQVASLRDAVVTMADLHHNICADGQNRLAELQFKQALAALPEERQSEGIAIVGMSCMFPQGNDVETYWQNILNKVDTITEIPESHFSWQNYYDENPLARDRIVSKWGGFLSDVVFDPKPYGIPPSSLDSIDPMQVLVLESARSALYDAGYNDRKFPREKTSVILANAGHGPITALYSLRSMLGWKLAGLDEATQEEIKTLLPEWTEDSFAGYLGNVTAGRVANRLDLKGLNFSIDAACASSLAALYVGIADLRAGTSDVVLLGATDTHNQPGDYLSFSKTHALSPKGRCQTFDADADGIVISEGLAMIVLKRLSDAERDGDRIYAVIKGIGGSSDGRDLSLTAPRPAGQMLALERAYSDAGISPSTVGLVEAHGTGTVAGDKAEVEALTRVFQSAGAAPESCAIGSVKTNIGHSKAAAGLASIVKIAKALHHKVLPPSINVKTPSPACKFGEGPFYLNTECRPWIQSDATTPRRAGVSAFGFGGTNFHTVLEEYVAPCVLDETPTIQAWPAELFVWKAASQEDLLKSVKVTEAAVEKLLASETAETTATSMESRKLFDLASKLQLKLNDVPNAQNGLSITASSLVDLKNKIAIAKDKLQSANPDNFSMPIGIHYVAGVSTDKKVAYLFPGQGSQRVDMLKGLALYFPELRRTVEEADVVLKDKLKTALSTYIYPSPSLLESEQIAQNERLTQTQIAQPALGVCDLAMYRLLSGFGVKPDMLAGHSYGEYVALHAAGVFSVEQLLNLSADRGRILGECAAAKPGAMAAVSSDQKTVESITRELPGVYLANINTPKQCIISGATDAIESALVELKKRDIACKKIPVSAAFHSPLLGDSKKPLSDALKRYKYDSPGIAVYSNTTAAPYSARSAEIIDQLSEHALKPVLFAQQLQAMFEDGARIFVEVGPGAVLTGLLEATLSDKNVVAISTERNKNPLEHFLSAIGLLTVHGVIKDIGKLFWNRMPGVHGHSYDLMVSKNRSPLLYRVNSVKIERVEKIGNKAMTREKEKMARDARNGDGTARKEIVKDSIVRDERSLPTASTNVANGNGNGNGNGKHAAPMPQQQVAVHASAPQHASQAQANGMPQGQPGISNGAPYGQMNARSNVQQQIAPAVPQNYSQQMPQTAYRAADNRVGGSAERVLLDFQQSMMEMTNKFLETQERVMLAYLTGGVPQQQQQFQQHYPQPFQQPQHVQPQYVQQFPQQYAQQQLPQYAMQEVHHEQAQQPAHYQQPQSVEYSPQNGTAPAHAEPELAAEQLIATEQVAAEAVSTEMASASGMNTEALIDSLYEIVSERTGYPRTMLDPTLDLEADLGIDSIKRVEILNNFRKLLPEFSQEKLESGIEKLAGTKTLEGIIEWIRSLDDDTACDAPSAAGEQLEIGNADNVVRGLVKVRKLEAVEKKTAKSLAPVVLIVSEANDFASAVEKSFFDQGQKPVLVAPSSFKAKEVGAIIDGVRSKHGAIGSLIYMNATGLQGAKSKSETGRFDLVTDYFQLAKEVETDLRDQSARGLRSTVICVTFMGGAFNSAAPSSETDLDGLVQQAGLVGLTKTVGKEFEGVHVKALDFETTITPKKLAASILSEVLVDDDIVEIGYQGAQRLGLEVVETPYATSSEKQVALTSSSVVLVTGGARGITAEITLDLARRYKPNFIVVGRLPRPTDTESAVTAGLESQKEIKAAIINDMQANGKIINVRDVERTYQQLLREREVRTTLAKLQAAGSTVRYYSVDVTDEEAFSRLIDSVYETSNIDGVIHGAGIIEDALIKDKNIESFQRVFETKVKSALTLAGKLRFNSLQFLYFFSSVVGRTGNSGQCDYVSANEALSKLAVQISKNSPARVASLMWGPWQAGMAPPELEEVFASHGWSMIQPADGRDCFYEELNHKGKDEVEVLLVGKLKNASAPKPSKETEVAVTSNGNGHTEIASEIAPALNIKPSGVVLHKAKIQSTQPPTFAFSVDTKEHLYLEDHKFDGIPVMPMAVALEMMLEGARSVYPGSSILKVSNLDIPAGIVFHSEQKNFIVEAKPERGRDGVVSMQLISTGATKKVHFRCKVEMAATPNAVPEIWVTQDATEIPRLIGECSKLPCERTVPQPADVYGKWLFHGPIFQGIKHVLYLAQDGIGGNVEGASPADCITSADSSAWNIDPVLLDSSMQLAGIWARFYRDVTVLPTGFKTMHFFGPMPRRATAQVFLNPAMATELLCDLAIYDEDGKIALIIEGLGGIASKAFNRFSSQEPLKQLVQ